MSTDAGNRAFSYNFNKFWGGSEFKRKITIMRALKLLIQQLLF